MKGSKNKLNYLNYLSLLKVEAIFEANQYKWYRSFKNSTITIKNTPFTITTNNNKRELRTKEGRLSSSRNRCPLSDLETARLLLHGGFMVMAEVKVFLFVYVDRLGRVFCT